MKIRKPWLFLFALALNACATYPNVKYCHVAGKLMYGANCAENLTGVTSEMTFEEFLYFLEAQEEHVDENGKKIPAKGSALCMSSEDTEKMKNALDETCRMLGPRCSLELKQTIDSMKKIK